MASIDSTKYKTKFSHYKTADGESVVKEQEVRVAVRQ